MASNNRTPKSVLEAPEIQPEVVYASDGFSRAERRHGLAFKHSEARWTERSEAGRNVPFVKEADDE